MLADERVSSCSQQHSELSASQTRWPPRGKPSGVPTGQICGFVVLLDYCSVVYVSVSIM